MGDPSLGAWAVFGAGAMEADLPGFVVLCDPAGGPIGGAANWGAGYLPRKYAGKPLRSRGAPILHLDSRFSDDRRGSMRAILDAIDREHLADHPGEPELEARIESRDLAERMRAEAPEAVDLDRETAATKRLYGLDDPTVAPYGRRLLIARRLVERGVRFVQVYSGGGAFEDNWDAHYDLKTNHTRRTRETDQAVAALILDLRARGLLERTLVLWGGEFGRMPISQARIGRDHNPHGFTCWMAGGGVAHAQSVGRTDDFGLHAIERPVHVNDWHATILHLLGIDHLRLTVRHEGRDKRLTDVAGTVVAEALAWPASRPTDH
jgi:hypothetical protein